MNLEEIRELAVSPFSLGVIALSVASIGIYITTRSSQAKGVQSLPPGPPPDFLIGNLRQFPKNHTSAGFTVWAKQYGGLEYWYTLNCIDKPA